MSGRQLIATATAYGATVRRSCAKCSERTVCYSVKEIYFSLQGEGAHAGRPAVFCRFSGCNLWSGRESDRASALCRFCDTSFVGIDGDGGGRFGSPWELAEAIRRAWPSSLRDPRPFVVCTGGEPLLQLDSDAVVAMKELGCEVAVETNGTIAAPPDIDWICVSPKGGVPLVQNFGNELKLVYPQSDLLPDACENLNFEHYYLQPMDGANREANTRLAVDFCLTHPRWKLSLQTQKLIGIR